MRLGALACTALLAVASSRAAAEAKPASTPSLHASASCAPASKPGRIRCRAVVELPLEHASKQRITWAELRVVASDPAVTPLRGRLGTLDAEIRDPDRVAWSFSVAAAEVGTRKMTLRLLATVVDADLPRLVERTLEVAVRVEP